MVRRSDIDVFGGWHLDSIGERLLRKRHGLDDSHYREVLRAAAIEQRRYEDDLGPLPKPPKIEDRRPVLLSLDKATGALIVDGKRYVPETHPLRSPRDTDIVDAARVAHAATHPLMVGDVLDCGGTVVHIPEGPRVQELLENGTRLLDEARAARRETKRARFEADAWSRRAFELEMTLRRMDPVWRCTP
jgi:hypothetical protein